MKKLLVVASLSITFLCQADPIQISVTGTANSTAQGYTAGQSYTFNWVLNEGHTENSSAFFSSNDNLWQELISTDSMVFSAISGDGITGTYSQPSDPYSYLRCYNQFEDFFTAYANADVGTLGIQANGNAVTKIFAAGLKIGDFVFPETYTDPTAYFSNYTGTYATSGGDIRLDTTEGSAFFSTTSTTIVAIPEPSTLAFIGVFGGGVWGIRRFFLI